MILFQDDLIAKIDKYNIDTFPHTIMLLGDVGSGRHSICNYISQRLDIPVEDVTDNISFEYIEELKLRGWPNICLIDLEKTTVNEDNAILKFIEEPPTQLFIVLICTQLNYIPSTIINRCQLWRLQRYTVEQIKSFSDNDEFIPIIANTPGKAISLKDINISDEIAYCNNIFLNIHKASFSNVLKISNDALVAIDGKNGSVLSQQFSKSKEDKSFDLDTFVDIIVYSATELFKNGKIDSKRYLIASKLKNDLRIPNINTKWLFEKFLFDLKLMS